MISSIRATLPLAESPPAPALAEPRASGVHPSGVAAPVSPTLHAQAVQQAPPKAMAEERLLMEARMTSETSAAAAAEAARDAYIKASIAAGISPLPLP
jgi:hypothetical protein